MKNLTICLCIFSVLASCSTGKLSDREILKIAEERDKVGKCRERWICTNLIDTFTVRVLFASGVECSRENALLIGVTKKMDTIALYHWNYDHKVGRNDIVDLIPQPIVKRVPPAALNNESTLKDTLASYSYYYGEDARTSDKPIFIVSKDKSINDLFCRVTKIQAGNIKPGSLRSKWGPVEINKK